MRDLHQFLAIGACKDCIAEAGYWLADHAHGPAAATPILVMDMYEHSYQMDFGATTAKSIDAFFQNINWEKVNGRLGAAGVAKT